MKRLIIISIMTLVMIIAVSAQAGQAVPLEATVAVDCSGGDGHNNNGNGNDNGTIADALETPGVSLIIEISGICAENVVISRSGVTLRGSDPAVDGISVGTVSDRVLQITGTSIINIEDLKLAGGQFGLGINGTFGVNLNNVLIEDNQFGIIAGAASGSINFFNTVITTSSTGSRGLWATNGSNVRCFNCLIENYRAGVLATQASTVEFTGSTVQTTWRAIDASGGSRILTRFAASPNTFEGGTLPSSPFNLGAIRLTGTASADLGADTLIGRIQAEQNSEVTLWGTVQSSSVYNNNISEGSGLVAYSSSSLVGNYQLSGFSNLTLPLGSTVTGTMNCGTGADAYCDNPLDVSGGSNCLQCN